MGFWDKVRDVIGEREITREDVAAPATAVTHEQPPAPVPVEQTSDATEPTEPAESSEVRPSGVTHTVVHGDLVEAIAVSHGVDTAALVALNELTHPDRIWPGQVLQIPA